MAPRPLSHLCQDFFSNFDKLLYSIIMNVNTISLPGRQGQQTALTCGAYVTKKATGNGPMMNGKSF